MAALNAVMLCIVVIFLGIIAFELVKIRRMLTSSAGPLPTSGKAATGKPGGASQENP
jgi:hypothetical protein